MPSLYVHVPFCLKKCDYCAFYSVPISGDSELISGYLSGVKHEIELRKMEASEGLSSLFIGGGTPSVLQARELDQLLKLIHKAYRFQTKIKIKKHEPINIGKSFTTQEKKLPLIKQSYMEKTVELNPGTLNQEKLMVMHDYGVNRVSLGVQSFNDLLLQRIGRLHNSGDIYKGVELIRSVGFENLNLDLIFGLPGQTLTDWQEALRKATDLCPEHLSIYALTLEENTPIGRHYLSNSKGSLTSDLNGSMADENKSLKYYKEVLPDDDQQADMYDWAVGFLQDKGYFRYEISNFSKPGFECLHNSSYWQGKEYIGLGPGAVSCLKGIRTKNIENTLEYNEMLRLGDRPLDSKETEFLTKNQLISEYMMLGLRTVKGVSPRIFAEKFQVEIQDIYGQILAEYMDKNILCFINGRITINPSYFFIANSILLKFIL